MIEFYGGYQVYSESGVDLTLLRENLRRSLEIRWEYNRSAAALAWACAEAGRIHRGLPPRPHQEATRFDPVALLRQLLEYRVEFVIVGALAMTTHGSAYVTEDLDICYRPIQENITALVNALMPLHPCLRDASPTGPFHWNEETIDSAPSLALRTDLGDMDLFNEIVGIGNAEQVFAQSEEHGLFGLTVRVLSLEAIMVSKRAVGRRKDRLHLLELEELKKLKDASPEG